MRPLPVRLRAVARLQRSPEVGQMLLDAARALEAPSPLRAGLEALVADAGAYWTDGGTVVHAVPVEDLQALLAPPHDHPLRDDDPPHPA